MSPRKMKSSFLLAIGLALILIEVETKPAKQVKHCENDSDCAPGYICMHGTQSRTFRQPVCAKTTKTKKSQRSMKNKFRSFATKPDHDNLDVAQSYFNENDDEDYSNDQGKIKLVFLRSVIT